MSEQPAETPKVVRETVAPVPSTPWFMSTAVRWATGIVAGGILSVAAGLCELGIVCFKLTEHGVVLVLGGLLATVGGIIWVIKRIAYGNDPANPAPKVTLT